MTSLVPARALPAARLLFLGASHRWTPKEGSGHGWGDGSSQLDSFIRIRFSKSTRGHAVYDSTMVRHDDRGTMIIIV